MVALLIWSLCHGLAAATQTASQADEPTAAQSTLSPKEARERRKQAFVLFAKALQTATEGNFFRAIETLRKVAELDPTSPEPHVTIGELQYTVRNITEAKREAELGLKLDPKNVGAHRLLGRIYRDEAVSSIDKEKAQKAIEEFRQVVAEDDLDIETWQALAELYQITEQREKMVEALARWTSNDPTAEKAFYVLGQLHYEKREYRQAVENAAKALSLNPEPEYTTLFARALLAQGQTVEALHAYREALKRHPNEEELKVNFAGALVSAGKYDEAIDTLRQVPSQSANYIEAVRLMAQAHRRAGRRQEAIDTLKNSLKGIDVNDSLNLQFTLAQTYGELGQVDDAVATYEQILGALLNPDGSVSERDRQSVEDVLTYMGLAYTQAGRREDAIRVYERMRKLLGAGSTRPDTMIINTLMDERKYEEAAKRARDAADRFPKEQDFRLLEAQALGNLGRVDEALKLLDGQLTNTIDDLGVLSIKALVLSDAERYQEAETVLKEALRRDPRNNGLLIQLSIVQEKLKRPSDAEATLRAILERDPDNPVALNNLGYYLAERGERLPEALDLTKRAVTIEPNNGSYLDSLGWVYFQMGQLGEAQRYLEQALENQPNDATIHDHMGDLYLRQGRRDQARRSFERALSLSKEKEERQRIQRKLDQLTTEMRKQ